jgi:hypothetical protein
VQAAANPLYFDYADDAAAIEAERALVARVALFEDPAFGATGKSMYRDPFNPPRGKYTRM